MKRRQFLTTAALTAIGASVAPQILKGSQDPYLEYERLSEELIRSHTGWEIVPRASVHIRDNNYWKILQGTSEWGYGDIKAQWIAAKPDYFESIDLREPGKYPLFYYKVEGDRSGKTILPWDEGGILYMHYAVPMRDCQNVYSYTKKIARRLNIWMNVEDYAFYQQLEGMGDYSYHDNHLLGCGLVPGGIFNGINANGASFTDGYEIHVMWRKK